MNTFRFCLLVAAGCAASQIPGDGLPGRPADPQGFLRALGAGAPPSQQRVRDALGAAASRGAALGIELLRDSTPTVRAGAADHLGGVRSRLAVPHLIRALRDPEALVRRAAATALGAIGDPRALPFLERAMAGDEPDVAQAAFRAARQIRHAPADAPKPRFPWERRPNG